MSMWPWLTYFFFTILYILYFCLFFFFFTLQYCIGFAIHQHESATGVCVHPWLTYFNNFLGNVNSVTQSCLTFCYPMDCSLPGSSVHGISKAKILECVAISSSRGFSQLRGLNSHLHIFCIGRQVFTTQKKKKRKFLSPV